MKYYKKIKDESLYRSGRINNKIDIDKYSNVLFSKLEPEDKTKIEIFNLFREKLIEFKKYSDKIAISEFKYYNSFLEKLYNIDNLEKVEKIIGFTFSE